MSPKTDYDFKAVAIEDDDAVCHSLTTRNGFEQNKSTFKLRHDVVPYDCIYLGGK